MTSYTLKVLEVRKETKDCVTLCFKQPGLRKIKYQAGQYLTLIFRINGRRYIRPYSFSSAPHIDPLIEITVKRVPNGIVSNHINDMVAVGDSIEVMEAMGEFTYAQNSNADQVYLWGVGSGITPLISLAKSILFNASIIEVILIYGNKNKETTILQQQIDSIKSKYPNRFQVWHFHSQPLLIEGEPFLFAGRIDEEQAFNILKVSNYNPTALHYICGPVGLKKSLKNILSKLDFKENRIFTEDFELVKDPKDFVDIHTQIVYLKFEDNDYRVEVVKGKSILEAALDASIELPYSCQTGDCSTCKAKLLMGKLKMIGLTKSRNDLVQDEYLLCCSHPLNENVIVTI